MKKQKQDNQVILSLTVSVTVTDLFWHISFCFYWDGHVWYGSGWHTIAVGLSVTNCGWGI